MLILTRLKINSFSYETIEVRLGPYPCSRTDFSQTSPELNLNNSHHTLFTLFVPFPLGSKFCVSSVVLILRESTKHVLLLCSDVQQQFGMRNASDTFNSGCHIKNIIVRCIQFFSLSYFEKLEYMRNIDLHVY